MTKEGDDFICRNHSGRPFRIPGFKHAKIMRDLQARDDMRPPSGWNH